MSRNQPPSAEAELSEESVTRFRKALLAHYDRTARTLPWRGESDPYRVWVSEVMLQQTRVETVSPYYRRWMERFPDLAALAEAELDDVLEQWEGLGYYRRARNLHRGAAVVRDRFGGALPADASELREIPGVGEYTAGAIASIAFGRAEPAVDGNVKRVLARLFGEERPTPGWLRGRAAVLVDPDRPGDWNQALMDLGATVCTPRAPACDRCPFEDPCVARRTGTQEELPARAPRRPVPTASLATSVVIDASGRALVERRPDEGLLGGLWSFPESPANQAEGVVASARRAAEQAGASLDGPEGVVLPSVRHRFTHLDATYHPVMFEGSAPERPDRRWISLSARDGTALPVAQQRIAEAAHRRHADGAEPR
jgi:A/G-specific adenine glycosylase